MYVFKYAHAFKKDMKKIARSRVSVLPILRAVLETLARGHSLDAIYKNHPLHGEFKGCFECHLSPDLLLIYKQDASACIIHLLRIGSHAELFK